MRRKLFWGWLLVLITGSFELLAANDILIPKGALWRYNAAGTDLGTAWRELSYDDSSWSQGPAQLGYGDGDEATIIAGAPVKPCYYFRHTFSAAYPARYQSLNLEILRDDGAVVYLNGKEVARYNMPAGTISYTTWASSASEYTWDPPQSFDNLLIPGENVIAVEVHQGNSTSTDLSLDLQLTGTSEISLTLDSPAPGAANVPVNASLRATALDPQGQSLTVSFYGRIAPPIQPDFSLIVLPDIQNYTAEINGGSREILAYQTDWIQANRENLNIVYVAQMGDLSQNGDSDSDQSEWMNAASSLATLETPLPLFPEGIPFGVSVGNHDQIIPSGDIDPTTYFNQYFGINRFTGRSYYGGHYGTRNNNYFQLFSASGIDFIVIYLEYDTTPDPTVLDWANSLLQNNPSRRGIVVTHFFLETTGAWGAQGLSIYNALKSNPNLFLMLCGHNHGESQRTDVYAGNTVYTLLADYQDYASGGGGFLRILTFSPLYNQIRISTYSPWLNQFETDANSQFTLNYAMDSGPAFSLVASYDAVISGTQTSADWNGLLAGVDYEWYGAAAVGTETQASEIRRFTTSTDQGPPPAAPSWLRAFAQSDTQIRLAWEDNSENETGFEILQSGDNLTFALAGTVPANQMETVVTGLAPSTTYYFQVRAINGAGYSDNSNQASDTTLSPPPPPAVPSHLTASPISNTEIRLAWQDNSTDETIFEVQRSLDRTTWTSLPIVMKDTVTTMDEGLMPGKIYYYRVRAWNGSSASAPSATVAAAPFIYSYASSEILLTGTLLGSMSSTYIKDSGFEQITESLAGGKPSVRYSALEHRWILQATSGKSVVFRLLASQSASSDGDSFIFTYSTDNVSYQNMVTTAGALDSDGYQSFVLPKSLEGTVYIRVQDSDRKAGNVALDTLRIDHMLIRTEVATEPPSAPVLQPATAGNGIVSLSWSSSSTATTYSVWRGTESAAWSQIASGITSTGYSDSGLNNGTTYFYAIKASNSVGESEPSNEIGATPQLTTTTPPTSLSATAAKRKITLSWTQSSTSGITKNRIYRSVTSDGGYTSLAEIAPSVTYSDNVASGSTYFYRVSAVASGGESPASGTVSATAK